MAGATDVTLRMLLTGEDKSASRALQGVGKQAGQTSGKLSKFAGVGKAAMLGVAGALIGGGIAAVDFGKDSLAAFADADKSQKRLEDAYKRFPKTADVNIAALRKYNDAIQRKVGADADDIASGQATLAQYNLTGKQIKDMTPLLVDYATKTGKDMPTAAKTLGKAMMGNGKAMKDLGINFKDAKDPAKNYAAIMAGLKEKVGGFANSIPDAEKKQKILAASFGDLQEQVGAKLQPVMMSLIDAGQGVLDWLEANPAVVAGAEAAFGLLGDAMQGIWFVVSKFVAPALAWFIRGNVGVLNSISGMLDAMASLPGNPFPWAKGAAEKVRGVSAGLEGVAAGLDSLANAKNPKVDVNDSATEKLVKVDKKLKGLKDKLVKAKAKGDTKEVENLQKKIDKLKDKRVTISAKVKALSGGGWRVTGNVSGGSGTLTMKAFRQGGRPRVGEIAQFHKDEFWIPDEAGTVVSQSRSRSLMGTGPSAVSGNAGAAFVFAPNIDARGSLDELAVAKNIERALLKLVAARGGRQLEFMNGR